MKRSRRYWLKVGGNSKRELLIECSECLYYPANYENISAYYPAHSGFDWYVNQPPQNNIKELIVKRL